MRITATAGTQFVKTFIYIVIINYTFKILSDKNRVRPLPPIMECADFNLFGHGRFSPNCQFSR